MVGALDHKSHGENETHAIHVVGRCPVVSTMIVVRDVGLSHWDKGSLLDASPLSSGPVGDFRS